MAQLTNTEFKTQTTTLFPTNGVGGISAEDLRTQMDNIADSAVFIASNNNTAPTANDDGDNTAGNGAFEVGNIWIDETADLAYICVDNSTGAAVWANVTQAGGGAVTVQEESSTVVSGDTIDFIGSAVTVTDVDGVATVTVDISSAMPLSGGTFTGEVVLDEVTETVFTYSPIVSDGTAAITLDPANGGIQVLPNDDSASNYIISEAFGSGQSITLRIVDGDVIIFDWPTITWVGGSPPTLTANDIIVFWKEGTTFYGNYVGSVV